MDQAPTIPDRCVGAARIELGHERFRVPSAPSGNFALIPPGTPTKAGLPAGCDFGHLHAGLPMYEAPLAALDRLRAARAWNGGGALHSDGLTPTHTRMRVERALPIGTALGIAEVGMAVGYGGPGQSGRAFRKEAGLSPSQFRRERRA